MRLKQEQADFFHKWFQAIDREAKVYLFGSRTDENARGGDIDILVLTREKLTSEQKRKVYWEFCKKYGEQKVDIVNFTFDEDPPFKSIALSTAVEI